MNSIRNIRKGETMKKIIKGDPLILGLVLFYLGATLWTTLTGDPGAFWFGVAGTGTAVGWYLETERDRP